MMCTCIHGVLLGSTRYGQVFPLYLICLILKCLIFYFLLALRWHASGTTLFKGHRCYFIIRRFKQEKMHGTEIWKCVNGMARQKKKWYGKPRHGVMDGTLPISACPARLSAWAWGPRSGLSQHPACAFCGARQLPALRGPGRMFLKSVRGLSSLHTTFVLTRSSISSVTWGNLRVTRI